MSHFYLTLPSNSSQKFFPSNTMTDFMTKLASTIELTDEWEVGLAEIMFPRSWYTIPKDGLYIDIDYCYTELAEPLIARLFIPGGFYHSMEELIHELNEAGQKVKKELMPEVNERGEKVYSYFIDYIAAGIDPLLFYYKPTARRVFITVPGRMGLKFPPTLESILGLSPSQNPLCNKTYESITYKADLASDLQAGIHALYVYCDLLQFTNVGDIKAPLLRVVNSGGEVGDVVTRYYERPRYVPLQKKNFDSIQIIIRDDLGEKIQFENGKVLLTLHFRRAIGRYLL